MFKKNYTTSFGSKFKSIKHPKLKLPEEKEVKKSFDIKGNFLIKAVDVSTGKIVNQNVGENLVVQNGRMALAYLIGGNPLYSYAKIEGNNAIFPLTITEGSNNDVFIVIDGVTKNFKLGLDRDGVAPNPGDSELLYVEDIAGIINSQASFDTRPVGYAGHVQPSYIRATTLNGQLVLEHTLDGPTHTLDIGYGLKSANDKILGTSPLISPAKEILGVSPWNVTHIQLGQGNREPSILDEEFSTYTPCPKIPVTTEYIFKDTENTITTRIKFNAELPSNLGNHPTPGTNQTYTEAALICRNGKWFAHRKFGNIIKNSSFALQMSWQIDFMS